MSTSLVTDILEAIADAESIDLSKSDVVLYDYIGADALNQLTNHESSIWMLTFKLEEHEVTVTSEEEIFIDSEYARD